MKFADKKKRHLNESTK